MRTISVIIIQVINRLICSEPPSAQCIDCDIYAFQCILVSKVWYQLLVTSPVVTLTSARAFYIDGIFCWLLLPQLSREKTNFIIKQVLTIEALDMTLISTTEYQYWPRQSPRSILVFSGRYNVISNTSTVNTCNCIISACNICIICNILFIIKQVLTIESLDMTLISTIAYQYWPWLSPRSILVFSGRYHVISNTSTVNNCVISVCISAQLIKTFFVPLGSHFFPFKVDPLTEGYRIGRAINFNRVASLPWKCIYSP